MSALPNSSSRALFWFSKTKDDDVELLFIVPDLVLVGGDGLQELCCYYYYHTYCCYCY